MVIPMQRHLVNSESVLFCSFCHKKGKSIEYASPGSIVMKSCSRCQIAFYCDKTCQVQDLQSHKKYCKVVNKHLSAFGTYDGMQRLFGIIEYLDDFKRLTESGIQGTVL